MINSELSAMPELVHILITIILQVVYVCTCVHFKNLKRLEWIVTLPEMGT